MKKDFVMPILVLSIICLVFTGALAFTYSVTEPIISTAAAERENAARYELIPEADGFESISTEGLPASIREVYRATNDVGYIFIVTANGYGGEMRVICGIGPDGKVIRSSVLGHGETKGLGSKIEESAFSDQFIGRDNLDGGVDAVSRATISTNAYVGAIRDALAAFGTVND